MKQNLLDFEPAAMTAWFAEQGEKAFRAKQVLRWIYKSGESDFDAMSDLAISLREKLKQIACIQTPTVVREEPHPTVRENGCWMWVRAMRLKRYSYRKRISGTLCVSTQAGCALDCAFCSTGKQGFNRNLSTAEIIGQLWWANHELGKRRRR